MLGEDTLHLDLDPLAGNRRAVEDERLTVGLGGTQQRPGGVERRLARALCAAEPLDLGGRLPAAEVLEQQAVDVHLDAVRAQVVGELEREAGGNRRVVDAEARACANAELELCLRARRAAGQE